MPQSISVNYREGSETTPVTYNLCSVQYHLGQSADEGHYTATAMDWNTGIWYHFNDDSVSRVDLADVFTESSTAYILCFVERSVLLQEQAEEHSEKYKNDFAEQERHYMETAIEESIDEAQFQEALLRSRLEK